MNPPPLEPGEARQKSNRTRAWVIAGIVIVGLISAPYILCFGFFGVLIGMNEWENLKSPKAKEADGVEYFVDTFYISPVPKSLHLAKVLDMDADLMMGERNTCTLAFTTDAATLDSILASHTWTPPPFQLNGDTSFFEVWPGYKGELEHYYYKSPDSDYGVAITVSKSHTQAIFDVFDTFGMQ